MKKILILSLAALTLASVGAKAQGESNVPEGKRITCYHVYSDKAPHFSPKRGDWSIGVTFNPATLSYRLKMQPDNGDFAGDFIEGMATSSKQMFILSQDPLAAFRVRYYLSDNWAVRATLGLNGSHINYREYVDDDLAKAVNPDSKNRLRMRCCPISTAVASLSVCSIWQEKALSASLRDSASPMPSQAEV